LNQLLHLSVFELQTSLKIRDRLALSLQTISFADKLDLFLM